MARVYLSLGSNVEPERHLAIALQALRTRFGPLDVSPTYRSAAVGFAGAAFLNGAAAFASALGHAQVRAWLRGLEDQHGRDRRRSRYADRTLDLDIAVWCDGGTRTSDLSRDEFDRAHVLAPLADIAPSLRDPFDGEPLAARWQRLAPQLPKLVPWPAHHARQEAACARPDDAPGGDA